VDIIAQEDFYQLLGALRDREGLSVLLASHDIGGITALADRVACLNRQLHYYGPPGEALSPQVLERTFGAHMQFLLHDERCLTCRRQDG
jgi:zinc transport system ATP-binding protein